MFWHFVPYWLRAIKFKIEPGGTHTRTVVHVDVDVYFGKWLRKNNAYTVANKNLIKFAISSFILRLQRLNVNGQHTVMLYKRWYQDSWEPSNQICYFQLHCKVAKTERKWSAHSDAVQEMVSRFMGAI